MYIRLNRTRRVLPVILGVVTLASVGVLLAWDAFPRLFPARAHDVLAAFPLAMIAFAYIVYQSAHRLARMEFVKAIMLAVAFLFWAANQLWPDLRQATLFNDVPLRSSSSMCSWSWSAGQRHHRTSPLLKPTLSHIRKGNLKRRVVNCSLPRPHIRLLFLGKSTCFVPSDGHQRPVVASRRPARFKPADSVGRFHRLLESLQRFQSTVCFRQGCEVCLCESEAVAEG
jgi:hypothetical protein